MRIELSWKDKDKICSSIEEARAAWDDQVTYAMWKRDDVEPGSGECSKLFIDVDEPCDFDFLYKIWDSPYIFDECQVSISDVRENYPDHCEPFWEDIEAEIREDFGE